MTTAFEYANSNANTFRSQLHDLLRIPSVSTDPSRNDDVQQAAEWIAQNMRDAGIENVEIMPTGGHPVVYGDWLHATDAPTVLVYGHYDVQPAVKEDGWQSEPFTPEERDGFIYARGASDDKGQMFIHIKAVESLLETDGKLPVNIKFLLEGEEEIGSPNLPGFVEQNKDKLTADVCIISDTGMQSPDTPSIYYSLRGLVALEVHVQGPSTDLHSGGYGGAVHNPIQALTEILSALHNEDGSVAVPGFYDEVVALGQHERDELKKSAVSADVFQRVTGVPQIWGEPDYAINERIGARPTLEINGIGGGFQGDGVKTVLPAKAFAKITCRLVADQAPETIFERIRDYITQITPPTVNVEVTLSKTGMGHPVLVDIETPAMQAAIKAYEKGWGAKPIFLRGGGSIPIVADFRQILSVPVLLMGFGLNDDGAHGPNEHFNIEMFHKGIDTTIHFLNEISSALS